MFRNAVAQRPSGAQAPLAVQPKVLFDCSSAESTAFILSDFRAWQCLVRIRRLENAANHSPHGLFNPIPHPPMTTHPSQFPNCLSRLTRHDLRLTACDPPITISFLMATGSEIEIAVSSRKQRADTISNRNIFRDPSFAPHFKTLASCYHGQP